MGLGLVSAGSPILITQKWADKMTNGGTLPLLMATFFAIFPFYEVFVFVGKEWARTSKSSPKIMKVRFVLVHVASFLFASLHVWLMMRFFNRSIKLGEKVNRNLGDIDDTLGFVRRTGWILGWAGVLNLIAFLSHKFGATPKSELGKALAFAVLVALGILFITFYALIIHEVIMVDDGSGVFAALA